MKNIDNKRKWWAEGSEHWTPTVNSEPAIKSGKLKNTEYVNERKNCFFLM